MKRCEILIGADAEEFCLAFTVGWVKFTGHSIAVGEFKFSAVPLKNIFIISEIESGAKCFDIPVPNVIESYEETIFFLESIVGHQLIQAIEKINRDDPNRLANEIERLHKVAIKKYGEKPTTEKVYTEWLKEDISETLN